VVPFNFKRVLSLWLHFIANSYQMNFIIGVSRAGSEKVPIKRAAPSQMSERFLWIFVILL